MKRASIEFGSTWMEYLNIRTPILWVTNLEIVRILRSLKIGSVWDKYGEKVITRTIFFCMFNCKQIVIVIIECIDRFK